MNVIILFTIYDDKVAKIVHFLTFYPKHLTLFNKWEGVPQRITLP